jgi:hypothetical protein
MMLLGCNLVCIQLGCSTIAGVDLNTERAHVHRVERRLSFQRVISNVETFAI